MLAPLTTANHLLHFIILQVLYHLYGSNTCRHNDPHKNKHYISICKFYVSTPFFCILDTRSSFLRSLQQLKNRKTKSPTKQRAQVMLSDQNIPRSISKRGILLTKLEKLYVEELKKSVITISFSTSFIGNPNNFFKQKDHKRK